MIKQSSTEPITSFYIGFDIGSVSLNTVLMNDKYEILEDYYDYVHGKPFNILRNKLNDILNRFTVGSIRGIAITGTGGKLAT
jgi:activator of 2-hydroxyglutaryl-CoA dehydratase